jgi:hypothetical protein
MMAGHALAMNPLRLDPYSEQIYPILDLACARTGQSRVLRCAPQFVPLRGRAGCSAREFAPLRRGPQRLVAAVPRVLCYKSTFAPLQGRPPPRHSGLTRMMTWKPKSFFCAPWNGSQALIHSGSSAGSGANSAEAALHGSTPRG